ncbi:class I SAM-dependent methyltransferase [Streptomyces sp. NPDC006662]|uniref:class I SAM-dependent methyltransferase n=1 Tax=Streptomyces sp. NPDC006662 TaxID=3156902 RepID=UPI0033E6D13B
MTATSRHPDPRGSSDPAAVALPDDPAVRPLDRALLDAFAAFARGAGGAVADLGCGPGLVTAYLARRGLRAFGVDLSPAMVAVARRTYPGLRFEVGRTAALDVADGALGGVVSWYGTDRLPPEELPEVCAEFARVLAPGGHALVAFEAGAGRPFPGAGGGGADAGGGDPAGGGDGGPLGMMAGLLAGAGLAEVARVLRQPDEREPAPRGFLLYRKPPAC